MPPLSFDDLASLDDESLKLVLQSVVYEHLLPALAFASEELKGRVLGLLDDKARELLLDDLRGENTSESEAAIAQIAIEKIMGAGPEESRGWEEDRGDEAMIHHLTLRRGNLQRGVRSRPVQRHGCLRAARLLSGCRNGCSSGPAVWSI